MHAFEEWSSVLDLGSGKVSLSTIFGGGYDEFLRSKKFYRVVRGSKGSKKSKTIALEAILRIVNLPQCNYLVVRKVFGTLQQSCFTDLRWAIHRLGQDNAFDCHVSPLEIIQKKTGQKILFRGMDDPLKLASITVDRGFLNFVWIEEAYEIVNEEDFDKLMMSIRGKLPPSSGLWKQFTFSFNPWSEHTWLKERFWDNPDVENTFTLVTTYKCNEWLGEDDISRYEDMYKRNPRAARVICDGEWGIAEGLIYDNWEVQDFDPMEILRKPNIHTTFGLDFGYAISFNAFVAVLVDMDTRTLWIYDEMYDKGMTNIQIAKRITNMGYAKEEIWADSAEPKSVYELEEGFKDDIVDENGETMRVLWQLPRIRPALKGQDSVRNGIQNLQSFHMIVHPKCTNVIMELNNQCWDVDKDGKYTGEPIKDFDHCLVAGTKVLTDTGEKPIEDVKNGDLVMTHLGQQEVISAGMTQPSALIYRMILEDGTVLEGTGNHPVVTTDGVKQLSDVSDGDQVIQWSEKQSSMTAGNGTDIRKTSISSNTPPISIDMCGKNTTGQSQKDTRSITSTGIRPIMTSPISCALPLSSTDMNTQTLQSYASGESNTSQGTRTSAERGISPMKDMSGMSSTPSDRSDSRSGTPARIAEQCLKQFLAESPASALTPANRPIVEKWGLTTRKEYVACAVERSQQTNTPVPGPVLQRVVTVLCLGTEQPVQDLTVAKAHDFFANSILTCNCMDALRQSMVKFFIKGGARLVEARGEDRRPYGRQARHEEPQAVTGVRRVISTL